MNTSQGTNRREFIRMLGGTLVVSATAPAYAQGARGMSENGILVEASAITDRGGWVLDTQFYQQMGGNYLMAHGMGQPVKDATMRFRIGKKSEPKGKKDYYVFVRTKDWCPGEWESPGKFQIEIDGKKIGKVLGASKKKGWHWESLGKVNLQSGYRPPNHITIKDLTGFNGRLDAIYFSETPNPTLPDKTADVIAWKDKVSGRGKQKIEENEFDVVIVGGGITGCGAALAAESQGLKVALIQDRPLLGGNASEEIRVHTLGVHGKGGDILKKIDTYHYPNGHGHARRDQIKRENALKQSTVRVFVNYAAIGLEKEGRTIKSVDARNTNTGIIKRFKAPVFIDCSGDGMLGYWSGCDYRYGREAKSEFNEGWDKHGELWSPEKADKKVMGTSVLWNSYKANTPSDFPEVPWAMPVAKNSTATFGDWNWEYSDNDLHQVDDGEQIRDHVFRAIYGSFYNAKQQPKNALIALKWVAYIGGRRESRRIMGDYIYSMQDAVKKTYFPDTVVEESREIDAHYQRKEKGDPLDFRSHALFYKTHGLYYMPFRSFYAKDMDNLMMAGRCFSCTHIGLSGPRVMNTCGQMGIACGYAAAVCKKHNATPKQVGEKHIKELRTLIGYKS